MKLKLNVPTTLHDITLEQYSQFVKAFDNDDEVNEQYAGLKMLEIFCGVKTSEALDIKISEIQKITTVLNRALDEKPALITRFTLGEFKTLNEAAQYKELVRSKGQPDAFVIKYSEGKRTYPELDNGTSTE